jgi:hypothetical protein
MSSKLSNLWDDQLPEQVGEFSPRFQRGKVRRDALLTADRRDILG